LKKNITNLNKRINGYNNIFKYIKLGFNNIFLKILGYLDNSILIVLANHFFHLLLDIGVKLI
jgi:hypothetical protein